MQDTYAENYDQHDESWYGPLQFSMGLFLRFCRNSINFKQQ